MITVAIEVTNDKVASDEVQAVDHAPVVRSKKRGRVLVVDDAPDNQVLTQAFLNKLGVDSDVADNGGQGVQKTLSNNYDVVLMDIQMPEIDGFQAVKELRQKIYKGTVVALTAHAMKGDRERCLENGFDDYLCKPITRQSLQECLSRYLPIESPAHR
jgi:CheY-like chemotaxis protein